MLDINQTSKFGKVQVQFANEVGTRSVNLSKTRWRLPGTCEEGICYINDDDETDMSDADEEEEAAAAAPAKKSADA